MTCCFQGRCHGNTEEDGKLDSTSQRTRRKKKKKCRRKGGHGAKEVRVGSADIILLLVTVKWRRRGGHEKGLMGNSFSPVRFELLSQFKQCRGSKH